ncbi:MAG: DUF1926 domain-containing protein, partial [Candidatus Neomarinimicrobiota bacterium]
YLKERFHTRPRGLWLTERVWEPHLARVIAAAGIRYITVDDYHFLASGKRREDLRGYYLTDDQGQAIAVFPIQQPLRYAMPFQAPEETIAILRSAADESGQAVMVMADDGEKFGVWPGTHDRCYGRDRWLDAMFSALEDNRDWIETTTLGDVHDSVPPLGRIYLPTVSYFEMSEWTLPADQGRQFKARVEAIKKRGEWEEIQPFLRGGTWRNFQSLYDESNWMVKRNDRLSDLVARARQERRLPGSTLESVEENIWRAQCNCAYWHGVFGGLYLPHLRHAIFQALIEAEATLAAAFPNGALPPTDWDQDGGREWELHSNTLHLFCSEVGGVIRELDLLPVRFNLSNTLRRYAESYHSRLAEVDKQQTSTGSIHDRVTAKEPGLDKVLQVDTFPRAMWMDRFFSDDRSLARLSDGKAEAGDFVTRLYSGGKSGQGLTFQADGMAWGQPLRIHKTLTLEEARLRFSTRIAHRGTKPLSGWYGAEFNLGLLGGHSPDRFYLENGERQGHLMDYAGRDAAIQSLAIRNDWDCFQVEFRFPEPVRLWRYPVFTVNMSEDGFEKVYQGSAVLPYWNLTLQPGETMTIDYEIQVETWNQSNPSK